MAISEERFKVEDNEFDLPVADFLSILDTGIRNFVDNLLDYFPNLDPFNSSGSGGGGTGIGPALDIWGDETEVIPLYDVPITEEQANEIDLIIIDVMTTYGWWIYKWSPDEMKEKRSKNYGPFLMPEIAEDDIPEYATTHDYFKTSADVINKYLLLYPGTVHPSTVVSTGYTGTSDGTDWRQGRAERRYGLDEYGKNYYDYNKEKRERLQEAKGDLGAINEVNTWWTTVAKNKGWY